MTDWREKPDAKYHDAEMENAPRWTGDCSNCGAHYSASAATVNIIQSGDL